jgi:hypothetical protein
VVCSTIVKQIKLIHQKKLTPKELTVAGNSLHQNVVDCMKALLNARKNFGMYELDEEGKKTEEDLFEWDENARLTTEMGKRILRLFNSEAIQKTYARRRSRLTLTLCSLPPPLPLPLPCAIRLASSPLLLSCIRLLERLV